MASLALTLMCMTFTVIANLALKVGTQRPSSAPSWLLWSVNGHMLIGAGSFALAFMFYALLLRRLPLSLAQAILSIQFVLVILAANLVLHESIGTVRWVGIALMAIGLIVVGMSPDTTAQARPGG